MYFYQKVKIANQTPISYPSTSIIDVTRDYKRSVNKLKKSR